MSDLALLVLVGSQMLGFTFGFLYEVVLIISVVAVKFPVANFYYALANAILKIEKKVRVIN